MTDYESKDCFYFDSGITQGIRTLRCPKCKNHGQDIESRGDCKNLIHFPGGLVSQCMCYSIEHK